MSLGKRPVIDPDSAWAPNSNVRGDQVEQQPDAEHEAGEHDQQNPKLAEFLAGQHAYLAKYSTRKIAAHSTPMKCQ